jgi:hypothetical protein
MVKLHGDGRRLKINGGAEGSSRLRSRAARRWAAKPSLLVAREERDGTWWRRSGARDCCGGGEAAHGCGCGEEGAAAHGLAEEEERRRVVVRAKSRIALGLGERRRVMKKKRRGNHQ